MQFRTFFAATLLAGASLLHAPGAWAMSQKSKVTVRFHAETNARDGATFAMPIKLAYQGRSTYLAKVPEFSERNIVAIYPFKSPVSETWGCAFQLDVQGRIRLETMSNQAKGSALVVFIGTKNGQHQVMDMLIDRPVTTGLITVPRGMTELEVAALRAQFPVIGEEKGKKKAKEDPKNEELSEPSAPATSTATPSAPKTASRRKGPPATEPELPRVAD